MAAGSIPYVSRQRPDQHSSRLADMIRWRGDQQAEAARRSGDISAQMWGNVGNTIAQAGSQIARHRAEAPEREEQQRLREDRGRARAREDTLRMTANLPPEQQVRELRSAGYGAEATQAEEQQRVRQERTLSDVNQRLNAHKDLYGQGAQLIREATARPELWPELRPRLVGMAAQIDPVLAERIPEAWDPTQVEGILQFANEARAQTARQAHGVMLTQQARAAAADRIKQDELFTRAAATRLSSTRDQEQQDLVFQSMEETGVPTSILSQFDRKWSPEAVERATELALTTEQRGKRDDTEGNSDLANAYRAYAREHSMPVNQLTERQRNEVKARFEAAGRDPSSGGRRGMSETAETNVINRMTTQWKEAGQTARELTRQVRLMDIGLNAARNGDLAQGAQTVLVTFQKILDPTSVVRESEYMRSAAGQSLLTRMEGAAERLMKGGAGVPLSELEKFADIARQAAAGQTETLPATRARIGRMADRYNIPHDVIFDEPLPAAAPPADPGGAAAPARPPAGMVRVKGPDNLLYDIPQSELQKALAAGATRVP